ncbi:capsular polysaccharide biosynthesis protein CapF [Vibrio parahaemolyticus]|uniref:UDP-2-acetamido-2,6-beta-L-arabino-hexul-4-ose reductase n=1 Tax=Vibrio parahaemolyticus TaxID=670 RepID=A0A7M1W0R2_VIBPH|nr:capsular polysaccharide biosynthesis protein CapF [Vibrio parahaemolyticus]EJG0763343.1 capsular polysaccharide biosynthesis protein CapF [Vibrio parahaemolyticus O5:K30]EGQ8108436.1 capsular polysaccharide biosynthesis protein CapF [Vibrio parahaemolyticus]EHK6025667.1 capsular polysaccharide biosynthesis protein CapF [Vibrio parahaemolyticus]EHK9574027.1 capsular polysaccharide biosynthesis protein CapF [Vibrio parahaemolyticus]EHK9581255.1 capsular polysaccharide biosynthesis protein Cap
MKIVVTGAKGFIGKNLCVMLREHGYEDLVEIDRDTTSEQTTRALAEADFVYHLAGINRPKTEAEFQEGNADFTDFVVEQLKASGRKTPLVVSSSTQALQENAYGQSKRSAEQSVELYGHESGASFYIYRFPNVFGKWCRPNYNSFVATFCYNTLNDLDITINDPKASVTLVYIDDVCRSLIALLDGTEPSGTKVVSPEYPTTVGEVADLLRAFKESRDNLVTEDVGTGLVRALYSTYLSYMSPEQFSYTIPSYGDERGVFSEMLKTKQAGQFSFFTAHPGITRGGHYHHSKNEKFLVLKGKARFKFEHIGTGERYELETEGCAPQIVETVPGWSHDITNIGEEEMIVMLWANEIFDREAPDTFAFPL